MKSIEAPVILKNGIGIYFPPLQNIPLYSLITLDIYFTKSNPLFNWLVCDDSEGIIWSKTLQLGESGILFLYELDKELEYGFYRIRARLNKITSQIVQGEMLIGVTVPTPYILIGLHYSMYPVIEMA